MSGLLISLASGLTRFEIVFQNFNWFHQSLFPDFAFGSDNSEQIVLKERLLGEVRGTKKPYNMDKSSV